MKKDDRFWNDENGKKKNWDIIKNKMFKKLVIAAIVAFASVEETEAVQLKTQQRVKMD